MKDSDDKELPEEGNASRIARGTLQAVGGAVPFAGGLASAIAGAWSESEQRRVNQFLHQWIKMLQDEVREKEKTILEIMARVDLNEEETRERVESPEYQSLLKKAFRDWAGAENEDKRVLIRNILANAASSKHSSDDVVKMFLDWLSKYSIMHFQVIGAIYNSEGISRGEVWRKIGKQQAREDSADADLYKLLIRDLSTGGVVRQHREVDYYGNFVPKPPTRRPKGSGPKPPVSAFDEEEGYELTELGKQFVHYAMNEVAPRITFQEEEASK